MPDRRTRARNSAISSGGIVRPRHWLAFLAKICRASQPWTTARSTARGRPPATDMCAPNRGPRLLAKPVLHDSTVRSDDHGGGEEIGAPCILKVSRGAGRETDIAPADRGVAVGCLRRARRRETRESQKDPPGVGLGGRQ